MGLAQLLERVQESHPTGLRCKAEDGSAAGKELAASDEHQVRRWTSWYRRTISALLAHAFLSVLAATQPDDSRTGHDQLIPLTATRSAGCSPDCASSQARPHCS